MEDPRFIIYHVRVGSGTKVHAMSKGSSVTFCGEWTGRSGIWRVNEPIDCGRCLNARPGLRLHTPPPPDPPRWPALTVR